MSWTTLAFSLTRCCSEGMRGERSKVWKRRRRGRRPRSLGRRGRGRGLGGGTARRKARRAARGLGLGARLEARLALGALGRGVAALRARALLAALEPLVDA